MDTRSRARPRRIGARRRAAAPTWLGLALLLAGAPASAQQAGEGVTLTGVVLDAATGESVGGAFLAIGNDGPRAIADPLGDFRLPDVPTGNQRLLVQRFGYVDLELRVRVDRASEPLELRLEPDPLVLEGFAVTGEARVAFTGRVVDAATGTPLPWTSLWLRDERRSAAGAQGVFRIPDVPTGSYLLLVRQMGYASVYVPVRVTAPPEPVEVRLEPDPVVLEGLTVAHDRLRGRRNAYPGVALAYDRERLSRSGSPDVLHFLSYRTPVNVFPCEGPAMSHFCVLGRGGRPVEPTVYLDELPLWGGLDVLRSYRPEELYLVEVFGRSTVRAYTHEFVEQLARRPRILLPDIPVGTRPRR